MINEIDMPNIFNKKLKDLKLSDIEKLIDNEISESLVLDYKKDFDFSNKSKKPNEINQEIAKDITAIANSSGGYLIYGIKERDDGSNMPEKITGIDRSKGSENIEDWLNKIMSGKISPQVKFSTKIIDTNDLDKIVLVLEIPESLNKPHMVLYNGVNCYYSRFGTESKKADHLQVKSMFEFKDKYLKDFNNEIEKLNLNKDIQDERFATTYF